MASKLRCEIETLPFMYLGLPLGGKPKVESFWQPVMEKIMKKLDIWRRFHLSKGGPLPLRNSVLSYLPYYMSTLIKPSKVRFKIEKKIHNFLWEGCEGGKIIILFGGT